MVRVKNVVDIFIILIFWLGWIETKYENITNSPPTYTKNKIKENQELIIVVKVSARKRVVPTIHSPMFTGAEDNVIVISINEERSIMELNVMFLND